MQIMTRLLSMTKGLKVCHTYNMEKKIQKDLSSYLKRSREDLSSYGKDPDGFSTGLKLFSEVSGQHIRE